jgi:GNAT superfamily N-acetyltransferase
MRAVSIGPEALEATDVQVLIAALDDDLAQRYPNPEDNFTDFGPADGEGALFVARLDGEAVGCGGVRLRSPGVAEVKRMYVRPDVRGQGIGRQLLAAIEGAARDLGAIRLVLETGERQHEAVALYEASGFARVPCFDEYASAPLSLCLAKDL